MAVAELEHETLLTEKPVGWFIIIWRRLRRHKLAMISVGLIVFFVVVACIADLIVPYDPLAPDPTHMNAPPSAQHWMGTDEIGRDIFSRLIKAAQISLTVAFFVTTVATSFGAIVGAISGFYGRWVDAVLQRVTEFLITLPLLPLLLAFSAILKGVQLPWLPREWSSAVIIMFVLTAFGWMGPCRLVRGMVLSLRGLEFVEASRALGMGDVRIILKHMIPNALPPLIVSATLGLGTVIVTEAALSFLGLGIQPPMPTWGNMLNAYQRNMWQYPMQVFFPGLAIFLTTLAFNYFGDGMRDALDPRLKM